MAKLTLNQWINVLAAIPAAISLGVVAVCTLVLIMFWLAFHGLIFALVGYVLLFFAGMAFIRGIFGSRKRGKNNRAGSRSDQGTLRAG